jgi:hypothetical protein
MPAPNAPEDPLTGLSIGTWSLLPDVRRGVAKWLTERTNEVPGRSHWPKKIPQLIAASLDYWRVCYSDKNYQNELAKITNGPGAVVTTLLEYLEDAQAMASTSDSWPGILERLLMPYMLPIDPTKVDGDMGWWFPPADFLKTRIGAESPYPFLTHRFFTIFAKEEARRRAHVVQRPARVHSAVGRFAQGMTSLQTKIVGDYELLDVPSKTLDRLVGNGSAILYVIRNTADEPIGVLCIASPILGLFHELLLDERTVEAHGPGWARSVLICRAHLTEAERALAADMTWEQLKIRMCPHCGDNRGLTQACPLFGLSQAVDPLIGHYLNALSRVLQDENTRRVADLAHEFKLRTVSLYGRLHEILATSEVDRTDLEELCELAKDVYECVDVHPELTSKSSDGTTDLTRVAVRLRLMAACLRAKVSIRERGTPKQVIGKQGHWEGLLNCLLQNAVEAHMLAVGEQWEDGETADLHINFNYSPSGDVSVDVCNLSQSITEADGQQILKRLRGEDVDPDDHRGLRIASQYIQRLNVTPSVRVEPADDLCRITISVAQGAHRG